MPDLGSSTVTSRYICDWENEINKARKEHNRYIIFVESPPGILIFAVVLEKIFTCFRRWQNSFNGGHYQQREIQLQVC